MRLIRRARELTIALALAFPMALCVGCASGDPDAAESGDGADSVQPSAGATGGSAEDRLFQLRFLACLTDAGIPAELTEDGGVHMIPPPGQEEAASAAAQQCSVELGLDGSPAPLDEETLRALYPRYVETIQCLREGGFDPAPPVSEAAYLEAQVSPYEGLDLSTLDAEILEQCPEPRP